MLSKTLKIIVISLYLFIGCNKETSNPTFNVIGDSIVEKFTFPLAVGNRWIYLDAFNDSLSLDTTEIIGYKDSAGYRWWYLKNKGYATSLLANKFIMKNDSLLTTILVGHRHMF